MPINIKQFSSILFIFILGFNHLVMADGNSVDKVYHPYVLPLETEIEWRAISQHDDNKLIDNKQTYLLSFGRSFFENWFTEIYLIGENTPTKDFDISGFEIEAKLQLSEQGEYSADWGLLFELERNINLNLFELATALLVEKEWGRWITAGNFFVEFERSDASNTEIETAMAMQLRYRYSPLFEPALEFYTNQDTLALGPAIMGDVRLAIAKKIHWEFGVLLGLSDKTPDQTVRALIEYEF